MKGKKRVHKGWPQVTVEPGPLRDLLPHCVFVIRAWVNRKIRRTNVRSVERANPRRVERQSCSG